MLRHPGDNSPPQRWISSLASACSGGWRWFSPQARAASGSRLLLVAHCATLSQWWFGYVIQAFRHKGLRLFFETGKTAGIQPSLGGKLRLQLAALHSAAQIEDLDLPGYRLHLLKGSDKGRWSIWVNGNWRLTFVFRDGHVFDLDFEDYH